MSHLRTQLRDGLVTALTGLATTGSRVHASRMRPATADKMPCLLIATGDEQIDGTSTQSGPLDRRLMVHVRGYAMGATVDVTLDQIALEVETALVGKGYALQGIDVEFDDELEKPIGSITLNYEILYFTQAGNPGVSA